LRFYLSDQSKQLLFERLSILCELSVFFLGNTIPERGEFIGKLPDHILSGVAVCNNTEEIFFGEKQVFFLLNNASNRMDSKNSVSRAVPFLVMY
jgi:hypothetical protein